MGVRWQWRQPAVASRATETHEREKQQSEDALHAVQYRRVRKNERPRIRTFGTQLRICVKRFYRSVAIFLVQLVFVFDVRRIGENAIDRTHLNALRGIEVADALGAFVRIDNVNFRALCNGAIRTLGFAHVAVNAFVGDQ